VINSNLSPERIYLFGSRAKGNAEYSSDFDIAIDASKPSTKLLDTIEEQIEKFIGLFKFDLVFLKDVDEEFRKIVLKNSRILYERRN
jgi:CRISPR-associated protein Cmr1